MSVPPLVSSTPPPLDRCDDEFAFRYPDSDELPPFDFAAAEGIADEPQIGQPRSSSPPPTAADAPSTTEGGFLGFDTRADVEEEPNEPKADGEEDNNIEDLDLRLDALQLSFQTGKDAIDESLSDSFDDFGTFLSSNSLNDVPDVQSPQIEASDGPKDESPDRSDRLDPSSLEEFDVAVVESTDTSRVRESPTELHVKAAEICSNNLAATSILSEINSSDTNAHMSAEDFETQYEFHFDLTKSSSNINVNEVNDDVFNNSVNIPEYDNSVIEFPTEFEYVDPSEINNGINCDNENVEPSEFYNITPVRDVEITNSTVDCDDDFDDFADFKMSEQKVQSGTVEFSESENANSSLPAVTPDIQTDDDFGDFDTYIPVSGEQKQIDLTSSPINRVNDVASTETNIFDQMCTNVGVIFPDETDLQENDISPEPKCELKLSLGESWSRLVNYEMEQTYLFPWNNSTSQKSLLKCLGIDSRNILFGSKWTANMPRFAANLGVSPLQPIKPKVSNELLNEKHFDSQIDQSESSSIKDIPYENGPHYEGGDFQASSYAESLLLDLEHLMATLDQMTSSQSAHFKISDLFTNACNERDDNLNVPHSSEINSSKSGNLEEKINQHGTLNIGRKINLPDTHIFTPTDSVTPWSHTIHYNDESVDPFPDHVSNSYRNSHTCTVDVTPNPRNINSEEFSVFNKNETEKCEPKNPENKSDSLGSLSWLKNESKPVVEIVKNMPEEIDDFGDFQSATRESLNVLQISTNVVENVLKPVKVSPDPPIVNWPSPGEVKTTYFDDFSNIKLDNFNDSKVAFPSLITPFDPQSFVLKESKIISESETTDPVSVNITNKIDGAQCNEDNFPKLATNANEQLTFNNFTNNKVDQLSNDDFDDFQCAEFVPPNNFLEKSIFPDPKPISGFNTILPNNVGSVNNSLNLTNEVHQFSFGKPLNPTIVRPSEESTSRNYSQQILQPLSLEGYSHINWPNPGTDFHNLSKFNPVDSIKSYAENNNLNTINSSSANERSGDDDGWSDFVSIKPSNLDNSSKATTSQLFSHNGCGDGNSLSSTKESEDWSDFVSSVVPSKNSNELKTISHNIQSQPPSSSYVSTFPSAKNTPSKNSSLSISTLPHLNYVSPKSNINRNYATQFQNL